MNKEEQEAGNSLAELIEKIMKLRPGYIFTQMDKDIVAEIVRIWDELAETKQ